MKRRCTSCDGRGVIVDREHRRLPRAGPNDWPRWEAPRRPVHCIRCDGSGIEPEEDR